MGDRGDKEMIFCVRRILPWSWWAWDGKRGWWEARRERPRGQKAGAMVKGGDLAGLKQEGRRGAEGRLMSVPEAGAEKVMLILDAW